MQNVALINVMKKSYSEKDVISRTLALSTLKKTCAQCLFVRLGWSE